MQTRTSGIAAAAAAMVAVGSGVAISDHLIGYPVFTAQAIRYGLAAMVLFLGLRIRGRAIPMPIGRDWVWLLLLAAAGQALYNVAIVRAVGHAEPAAVAVLVGSVPLLLIGAEALRTSRRPSPAMLVGVILVVGGAGLVQGGGRTSAAGVGWSVLALGCEAAFTLLAIPVLGRLGPLGVSTHTCWIAAVQLALVALMADGTAALPSPGAGEAFAIIYLAVVLTAAAFVAWYYAVQHIGPATAGLFAGLIPVSAGLTGLFGGLTTLTAGVLGGSGLVGVGIAIGLTSSGSGDRGEWRRPDPSRCDRALLGADGTG